MDRKEHTRRSCRLEAVWSIEDREEGLVVDCTRSNPRHPDPPRAFHHVPHETFQHHAQNKHNPTHTYALKTKMSLESGHKDISYAPSRGAAATMSATSACVGFCPSARSRSPSTSRGTAPVPFLSNSANASLYSVPSRDPSVNTPFVEGGSRGWRTCVIALFHDSMD